MTLRASFLSRAASMRGRNSRRAAFQSTPPKVGSKWFSWIVFQRYSNESMLSCLSREVSCGFSWALARPAHRSKAVTKSSSHPRLSSFLIFMTPSSSTHSHQILGHALLSSFEPGATGSPAGASKDQLDSPELGPGQLVGARQCGGAQDPHRQDASRQKVNSLADKNPDKCVHDFQPEKAEDESREPARC